MAQQKAKRKNALLLILLIMSVGGLSGWQITRSTGFLSKKTVSLARTQPEQFTLIGTCNQEACLFKSGTTVLGTATLRGYYKTTEGKIENYIKGGSGGKEIVNTKNEFIVVSKTLSRDAVPLLEYLVPESINSTEDNVDIKKGTKPHPRTLRRGPVCQDHLHGPTVREIRLNSSFKLSNLLNSPHVPRLIRKRSF